MSNEQIEALRKALEQQHTYERENWPFVGEDNKPTGSGESITYHLASLYCWSPEFVMSLDPHARIERLKEVWRSFSIAGDIIKRYEDAVTALLNGLNEQEDQAKQRPAPTDEQIKFVAAWAARERWDIESWQWPTWTNFKQTGPDEWELTYDEPDTGTPETIDVQRVGNELHAYAWTTEIPVIYKLDQEKQGGTP